MKLNIRTRAQGEPAGYDSTILIAPTRWYSNVDGQRTFLTQLAEKELRQISETHAADMGETLHHADWTVTSDPEQVRALGLMHDCGACRAAVAQAETYLRHNPHGEVAVGQLWWAQDG